MFLVINMAKIYKNLLSLLIIILLTISTASGELITKTQMTEYAELYIQNEGRETPNISGPYYYQENPYYFVIYRESQGTFQFPTKYFAVLVFDANNGILIENEDTAKKVINAHLIISSIMDSGLNNYTGDLQTAIDNYRMDSEFWNSILTVSWIKSVDADHIKSAASITKSLEESYLRLLKYKNETIEIENNIIGGEWTTENAELYVEKNNQFIHESEITEARLNEAINELPEIYDAIISSNYYDVDNAAFETYKKDDIYYITIDINNINVDQTNWEHEKSYFDSNAKWYFKFMKDRIESNRIETSNDINSATGIAFITTMLILLSTSLFINRKNVK